MATKWGLFLCNCRGTLALDLQKLVLPVAPSVLCNASDPDTAVEEFAAAIGRERPEHVLVACCADPEFFAKALDGLGPQSPLLHFVDLKDSCFGVHSDIQKAHLKATRLLRMEMHAAETKEPPAYNPLNVGQRVLIVGRERERNLLAEALADIARPIFVGPRGDRSAAGGNERNQLYEGRVVAIKGRLGDFRVAVEIAGEPETARRELQADQVIILSRDETAALFKPRTGCHLLTDPTDDDLEQVAQRVRARVGEFLKPVHVHYDADICAGGAANKEACGVCISACPYDAIARSPENHLRMRVEHMACEGCGACVSACPTSALRFTEPSPRELYTRMAALLNTVPTQNGEKNLALVFHCSEHGRRVLKEAARRSLAYPANILSLEVPCLRYVSEANMLAAFRLGAAGVGLLGCERCHHGERELLHRKIDFSRLTLDAFGMGAERLRLLTAGDGIEAEAIAGLSLFAENLQPAPIRWDGTPMLHWENREVVAESIRTFIDQLELEPGRRPLSSSQVIAFADVNASGCTLCRSCVNVCPSHAFKLDESTNSLQFKHIACVACGLCEQACPEHVITLDRAISFNREALEHVTVAQDDMVSCSNCGKPYINRRALETIEARLFSLQSLFDTFSGNRRNLLRMCPDCRTVVAIAEVEKGWKP